MLKALYLVLIPTVALGLLESVAQGQIPNVSPLCEDRAPVLGISEIDFETSRPARTGGRPNRPASDLHCIDLVPTPRASQATGVVAIGRPWSPFGVTVTPEGRHRHTLTAWIAALPDPATLGPFTTYVAWATPLTLDPVISLGEVSDGMNELGEIAF
ncbi:uncharacterized protein METZ01_LOCUS268272, partial [marine metagenome]